jgi:hypothetical protein
MYNNSLTKAKYLDLHSYTRIKALKTPGCFYPREIIIRESYNK